MNVTNALIAFDKRNFHQNKEDLTENIICIKDLYEWGTDLNNFTIKYNMDGFQLGEKSCYIIINEMVILALDIIFIFSKTKIGEIKNKVIYARFHNACGEASEHNWYYKEYLYCTSILKDICVKLDLPEPIESNTKYYIDEIGKDIDVTIFA